MTTSNDCPLCRDVGGLLVLQTPKWRVIRSADDANFPAFYRLIWQAHMAEFSDLSAADRSLCMEAVVRIEQVLREVLQPTKINLATLGNVVPHLHWHVIARFDWDARWPAPVWAPKAREVSHAEQRLSVPLPDLDQAVARVLKR
jgi:diadenosine tetraphosphate (Ap4A) HIT family hydrolase